MKPTDTTTAATTATAAATAATPKAVVELTVADLVAPGTTFCPNPRMALWSAHPKVFIDVGHTGVGRCPYCGTVYRMKAGEAVTPGH